MDILLRLFTQFFPEGLSKAPPVAAIGMSASILWVLEISEIHVRVKMCIFRNCLIFHLVASLPFSPVISVIISVNPLS